MTTYPVPASVTDNIARRAEADRSRPCGAGTGGGHTCGQDGARLYPCGWRCATHQPGGTP